MRAEDTFSTVSSDSNNRIRWKRNRSIMIKLINKASVVTYITLVSLVLLTVYTFLTFDYSKVSLIGGMLDSIKNINTMFLEAHFKHFTFGAAVYQVIITLGLAFLTTLFGAVIALFLALFAAQNLSSKPVSVAIKGIVAFIRAVPTVLWVLIFAVAAGLGSVAAVIGMTFHSVGYLIKAFSESYEEVDEGVIEALKASGANWWQIVFQAVLPSSVSYIISWTFLRFEINFAVAIAMGAAAGAGGIGYEMFMAGAFYFDLREVGAITYFVLAFAIGLELIATRIKRNLNTSI
jgi:phosphonate transport system permease protein